MYHSPPTQHHVSALTDLFLHETERLMKDWLFVWAVEYNMSDVVRLNWSRHPGTSSANILSEIIRNSRMESQHKWFFLVQLSRQLSLMLKRIANIFLSEHVLFGCGCAAKESFRKRAGTKNGVYMFQKMCNWNVQISWSGMSHILKISLSEIWSKHI